MLKREIPKAKGNYNTFRIVGCRKCHLKSQTYLRYRELKTKLRSIIMMQDWPKGIFLHRLAKFPYTNSHLVDNKKQKVNKPKNKSKNISM